VSILSISQLTAPYPATNLERDKWVLERRPARETLDPQKPHSFFVEQELSASGKILPVATIFLTNRECPWHCVMCDLWRNTLTTSVPSGAIPAQIDFALSQLPAARVLKLYNSGSFFDSRAIPVEDHAAIAGRASNFERLIVENHPALVDDHCLRFRDRLKCRLEIAMGLETVHPDILPKLNKRMTLAQFSAAATFLRARDIDLRVFVLVQPPFMKPHEAVLWAQRSVDFAFDCDATAVTLIPTRGGNGAMEALASNQQFSPPRLETLEESLSYGLGLKRGRVFADLWDAENIPSCSACRIPRITRLRHMNLSQINLAPVRCDSCDPAN
jgi:radical SAM enzyme (TIGR01210 family)